MKKLILSNVNSGAFKIPAEMDVLITGIERVKSIDSIIDDFQTLNPSTDSTTFKISLIDGGILIEQLPGSIDSTMSILKLTVADVLKNYISW